MADGSGFAGIPQDPRQAGERIRSLERDVSKLRANTAKGGWLELGSTLYNRSGQTTASGDWTTIASLNYPAEPETTFMSIQVSASTRAVGSGFYEIELRIDGKYVAGQIVYGYHPSFEVNNPMYGNVSAVEVINQITKRNPFGEIPIELRMRWLSGSRTTASGSSRLDVLVDESKTYSQYIPPF